MIKLYVAKAEFMLLTSLSQNISKGRARIAMLQYSIINLQFSMNNQFTISNDYKHNTLSIVNFEGVA